MTLKQNILNFIQHRKGDFNQLALAVFSYQFHACQPYQRYCLQLNLTPDCISSWQDIPSIPTDVFRTFDLTTFDAKKASIIFETSGTTNEVKGKHYYRDLSLYDAAIRHSFLKGLQLHDGPVLFRILTPSFSEVPTSSLFYMFTKIIEWYGDAPSRFYMVNQKMDYSALCKDLTEDVKVNRPVVVMGTAFSFVNLFDYLKIEHHPYWILPHGSRLLETGGLKGRTRSVGREELYQQFNHYFGLNRNACFSEYGMTELSSQCYSKPNSNCFIPPHWMKVRILNPKTNSNTTLNERGLMQLFDLANLEAVSAILTGDMAIQRKEGFELVGRLSDAVVRGCSHRFENII